MSDQPLSQATEAQSQTTNLSEHEAAMIAKADSVENADIGTETFEAPAEESLYAGKYKSPEDLEKAYKELEAKLGAPKDTEQGTEQATEQEAKDIVEAKGIDFDSLTNEYIDNGGLSENTYAQLEAAGIPKSTVDMYIAGQQALQEQTVSKMMSLAGGEEQFNDMLAWANENLTPGEQKAYNDAVLSEGSAEFAIQGLYARYRQAAGAPNFVNTQNTPASTNGAYQSQREMMVDMANPKYHKDPAFRKMVQQKVARSKF